MSKTPLVSIIILNFNAGELLLNCIDSLTKLIDHETAAILVAPIQGEGGIRPVNLDFLKSLQKICFDN